MMEFEKVKLLDSSSSIPQSFRPIRRIAQPAENISCSNRLISTVSCFRLQLHKELAAIKMKSFNLLQNITLIFQSLERSESVLHQKSMRRLELCWWNSDMSFFAVASDGSFFFLFSGSCISWVQFALLVDHLITTLKENLNHFFKHVTRKSNQKWIESWHEYFEEHRSCWSGKI